MAHHPVREPVPGTALVRPRVALGGALPARRGKRVDARAEQREERGQHGQCDKAGERRNEQAADRHRAQETEGKGEQRAERGRDGDRAERNRATGGLERRAQCGRPGPMAHELLAVAREQQQAVVDREAEAGACDEVEREDGDRTHVVCDADQRERDDDRDHAGDERQRRRDDASEDQEREQEEERERDQLCPKEVVLRQRAHLLVRDRRAAYLAR